MLEGKTLNKYVRKLKNASKFFFKAMLSKQYACNFPLLLKVSNLALPKGMLAPPLASLWYGLESGPIPCLGSMGEQALEVWMLESWFCPVSIIPPPPLSWATALMRVGLAPHLGSVREPALEVWVQKSLPS